MKMKFSFLFLFILGLAACSDKKQEQSKQEPIKLQQNQKSTQSQNMTNQEKNKQSTPNLEVLTGVLRSDHFLVYDITQILPHSKDEQNYVLHSMYRWRQNLPQLQECMGHNSFAQTTYAIHLQSIGNYTDARKYYLMAAEKGNAYAQNRLGEMYALGLGVQKDLIQAKSWFEKAAATGYAFSESALGAIYLDFPFNSTNTVYHPVDGLWFEPEHIKNAIIGKNADISKATYWLTRAAKQNDEYSRKMMEHFNLNIDETPIEENYSDVVIEQPNCRVFNRATNYVGKLIVLGKNRPLNYDTPLFKRFGHIQIGYMYLNNEGRINSMSSNKWGNDEIYMGEKIVPREQNMILARINGKNGKILSPNAGEK